MRVQEMFYIVNHALEIWVNPAFDEHKNRSGETVAYSCRNAAELVALLEPLKPFSEINEQIEIIYSTHDTFYKGTPGALTPDEKNKVCVAAKKIKSSLLTMQSMCAALGLERDSSGFDVKLPPNMTLSELSKCTKDMDNAFSKCPLLRCEDEEIRLRGVDVGSMWLTFTIIGACAATGFYIAKNLAAIVSHVMVIRNQATICKQYEELVRQSTLKNDLLQKLIESHHTVIKELTKNVAEELAAENNITDHEKVEQIRLSLDIFKEWMDKGMEIYAAVEAPKEIKAAFPTLEMQALPDFMTKELQAHQEEGE